MAKEYSKAKNHNSGSNTKGHAAKVESKGDDNKTSRSKKITSDPPNPTSEGHIGPTYAGSIL